MTILQLILRCKKVPCIDFFDTAVARRRQRVGLFASGWNFSSPRRRLREPGVARLARWRRGWYISDTVPCRTRTPPLAGNTRRRRRSARVDRYGASKMMRDAAATPLHVRRWSARSHHGLRMKSDARQIGCSASRHAMSRRRSRMPGDVDATSRP